MHISTGRIFNMDSLQIDIGRLDYIVPNVVLYELERLSENPTKRHDAEAALRLTRGMRCIHLGGKNADSAIVRYVQKRGVLAATMDRNLKKAVRNAGGRTISIHNDHIVLD